MKPQTKEAFQELGAQLTTQHGNLRNDALLYSLRSSSPGGAGLVASMVQEGKFLTLHLLFEVLGRPDFQKKGFVSQTLSSEQLETLWDAFTPFHGEIEKHPNVAFLAQAREKKAAVQVAIINKECGEDSARQTYVRTRTDTLFDAFNAGALRGHDAAARQALLDSFGLLPNYFLSGDGNLLLNAEQAKSAARSVSPCDENSAICGNDKFPSLLSLHAKRLQADSNRLMHNVWIRDGVHVGKRNIFMSNASVNIAAFIGDDNLIDAAASVGSAAQVGNKNKIGSFVSLEGVLSPANAQCVVIGDENFLGTYARVGTGIVVGNKNFIGSGVNLSLGTKLRDCRQASESRGDYVSVKTLLGSFSGLAIVPNNAARNFNGVDTLPGEYLVFENSDEFMSRFDGDDRIKAKK